MLKDKNNSLDKLIRDIIDGKQKATRQAVPLDEIMREVRESTDAGDDEILHWIKVLNNKHLIRAGRPNAYVVVDLDKRANELGQGILELINSIDEDMDSEMVLAAGEK